MTKKAKEIFIEGLKEDSRKEIAKKYDLDKINIDYKIKIKNVPEKERYLKSIDKKLILRCEIN